VGLAMAIPLRKGATLGYKVWRGWESDSTFATLTVLDSLHNDSGTFWDIGIRDSLIAGSRIRTSTATAWDRDTDTVWTTSSCLAAWDPEGPRRSSSQSYSISQPFPYGSLAGVCTLFGYDTLWHPKPTLGQSFLSLQYNFDGTIRSFRALVGGSYAYPVPTILSAPDIGWTFLSDPAFNEAWILNSVNGITIPGPILSDTGVVLLTNLNLGESWNWMVAEHSSSQALPLPATTTDTGFTVTWTVSQVLPDSGDWIRRTILDASDLLDFRFSPNSGTAMISSADPILGLIANSMIRKFTDLALTDGFWIRSSSSSSNGVMSSSSDRFSDTMEIGVGLYDYTRSSYSSEGTGTIPGPIVTSSQVQIRLNSHVTSIVPRRQNGNLHPLGSIAGLRQEVSTHPHASIRITDLSGRSRTFAAGEAMSALESRHGVLVVELVDGSSKASGRLFLP
jgi:hypothetical protein